ncbi:MAG: S8 family peptidase [Woeseiaceae bacterium]|nr:S8 family peptidase [Woeseiaceae bacterium]
MKITTRPIALAMAAVLLAASPIAMQSDTFSKLIGSKSSTVDTATTVAQVRPDHTRSDDPFAVPAIEAQVAGDATVMGPRFQAAQVEAERTLRADSTEEDATDDTAGPIPAEARAKMSAPVAALAMRGGNTPAEIIVSYADYPELFEGDRVESLGGEVVRRYSSFDMLAVRLPADALVELAIEDTVDRLSLDDQIRSLGSELETANVPTAGSINEYYKGSNVGIAVIDTGIDKHNDISSNAMQYSFLNGNYPQPTVNNGVITSYNDSQRKDQYGHGTHVAGILAGDGSDSDDLHRGTAQQAKLLALQVLDNHGWGSSSDVIAALDWLAQYGSYFDVRVVNLSLGQGITESNATDPMVLAAETLWDQGMVVVVASGNYGHSGYGTVMSPGNSRKVITVGSLTDNGTGSDTSDDYVSTFSSKGPTIGDFVVKPDLIAPGNRLVAAIPKNAKLINDLPSRVVACTSNGCKDKYFELSGTSMATPMVAAAVALMLEKDPSLTPDTIKARLMRSARKIDAGPVEAGAGVLDVEAALNDTGVMTTPALSPLLVPDENNNGVYIQDTAILWGSETWGTGYLWTDGATWASGYGWTDGNDVNANGYVWTDGGGTTASGYGWTDGVNAFGYGWTDGGGTTASGYGWTDGTNALGYGWTDGGGGASANGIDGGGIDGIDGGGFVDGQGLLTDGANGVELRDDANTGD